MHVVIEQRDEAARDDGLYAGRCGVWGGDHGQVQVDSIRRENRAVATMRGRDALLRRRYVTALSRARRPLALLLRRLPSHEPVPPPLTTDWWPHPRCAGRRGSDGSPASPCASAREHAAHRRRRVRYAGTCGPRARLGGWHGDVYLA